MTCRPVISLPAEWKRLTLQHIAFRGERYEIVVSRDDAGRVRLTRRQL